MQVTRFSTSSQASTCASVSSWVTGFHAQNNSFTCVRRCVCVAAFSSADRVGRGSSSIAGLVTVLTLPLTNVLTHTQNFFFVVVGGGGFRVDEVQSPCAMRKLFSGLD